ncbi:hypothetical protein CAPTEDRAFT_210862 [Capitella teleta]|uniref:Tyrosine-protein phosphatase domain-containing protein n=1 Tax=Capitella teleta TaxID=283909 RepID=R7TZ23_CAPTE|nr:hypothetical protein CAPTEDRAFT_210862 [Capitella teleta]|eukprot:ELT96666.1 hypothetical protein CAPTEDRAFT_210862 [Capitella teleta]
MKGPQAMNVIATTDTIMIDMASSQEQYKFIHLAVLEAHTVGSTNSSAAEFMSLYSALNRRSSVSPQTVFSEQTEILNSISQSPSEEKTGIARLAENSKKNRTEILPDNRHLMFLQMPFNERNDYINAVQVPGYRGKDNFVATQWPLEDTVVDFWRLVKDHDVQHIVLLEELSLKILPESGKTENFRGIDVYCKETEQNDTLVSYTVHFPEDTAEVVYMNTNTEEVQTRPQCQQYFYKLYSCLHEQFFQLYDLVKTYLKQKNHSKPN